MFTFKILLLIPRTKANITRVGIFLSTCLGKLLLPLVQRRKVGRKDGVNVFNCEATHELVGNPAAITSFAKIVGGIYLTIYQTTF